MPITRLTDDIQASLTFDGRSYRHFPGQPIDASLRLNRSVAFFRIAAKFGKPFYNTGLKAKTPFRDGVLGEVSPRCREVPRQEVYKTPHLGRQVSALRVHRVDRPVCIGIVKLQQPDQTTGGKVVGDR